MKTRSAMRTAWFLTLVGVVAPSVSRAEEQPLATPAPTATASEFQRKVATALDEVRDRASHVTQDFERLDLAALDGEKLRTSVTQVFSQLTRRLERIQGTSDEDIARERLRRAARFAEREAANLGDSVSEAHDDREEEFLEDMTRELDEIADLLSEAAGEKERLPHRHRGRVEPRGTSGEGSERVVFGGNTTVEKDEVIETVAVFGGNATIYGQVEEDVVVFGGNVTVYGTVEGDLVVIGGNASVEDDATINGDAVALGGNIKISDSANVSGDIENLGISGLAGALKGLHHPKPFWMRVGSWVFSTALWFVVFVVVGWIAFALLPERMNVMGDALHASPWRLAAAGVLFFCAWPVATIILLVTILGIPVALTLLFAVPLAVLLGSSVIAWHIGQHLPIYVGPSRGSMLAAGAGVLAVAINLPLLGWLLHIALCVVALGVVTLTKIGASPRAAS